MPRPRKSVRELLASKTWFGMSLAERQRRIEEEYRLVNSMPGRPPLPVGIDESDVPSFEAICDQMGDRLLTTDGPEILAFINAKRDGDEAQAAQISTGLLSRPAPASPVTIEPPATTVVPSIEATKVARQYAEDIVSGTIAAGKYAKLAAKRFRDDLERGSERGLSFDPASAQRVVDYVGMLGLCLYPWEVFVLANLYGFKKADGTRRFREGFVELGKKNGKTALMGALTLYMADPEGDHEPDAYCAIAATTRHQASDLCFTAAKKLREGTASVAERSLCFKSSIVFANGSSIQPMTAQAARNQGRDLHFGCLDELGDHVDGSLWSTFKSSIVLRNNGLFVGISTAGSSREGICWERRNHGIQVLEGMEDDSHFSLICELDPEDDWHDEKNWIKANPSLGYKLTLSNLRENLKGVDNLSQKYSMLRYNLNVWPISSSTPWFPYDLLDEKGNAYLDDEEKALPEYKRVKAAWSRRLPRQYDVRDPRLSINDLQQIQAEQLTQQIYCGGDFASVSDLCVFAMLFRPSAPGAPYELLARCWIPQESVIKRTLQDRVPYQNWIDAGYATAIPGDTVNYAIIADDIIELQKQYKFKHVGVDKFSVVPLVQTIEKACNIELIDIKQGFHLSPAIRHLEKLVRERRFCTHGNKLVNWCLRNVELTIGSMKGDARFDKGKCRERIDAAVAACCAIQMALVNEPTKAEADELYLERYKYRTIPDFDDQKHETEEVPKVTYAPTKPISQMTAAERLAPPVPINDEPDSKWIVLHKGRYVLLPKANAQVLIKMGAATRYEEKK